MSNLSCKLNLNYLRQVFQEKSEGSGNEYLIIDNNNDNAKQYANILSQGDF